MANNFFGSWNQPQTFQPQYQQQNNNAMAVNVQGEAGARIYPVAAGNTMFLIDFPAQTFWLKSTDVNGMPQTFREFHFEEVLPKQQAQNNSSDFITRKEFEQMQTQLNRILESLTILTSKGAVQNESSNTAVIAKSADVSTEIK